MPVKKTKTYNDKIVKNMRDYSKDPGVIEKAERMDAFLNKNGLPKGWEKPRRKRKSELK